MAEGGPSVGEVTRLDAVPASDLADALGDPAGVEALAPVVVVALDGAHAGALAALAAREPTPVVVVGVAAAPAAVTGSLEGCDVLLTDGDASRPGWVSGVDAGLATLRAASDACPQAMATLPQVLRVGAGRPVGDGLVLESLAYSTLQGGAEHQAWLAARSRPRPALGSGPPVLVERVGNRLTVRFDRPEVRNAYDAATRDLLAEALTLALFDSSVATVELSGAGPSFCAGGDLREFGTTPDPATAHITRTTRSPARLLAALGERTVARVHGACVGAGTELAAFCGRVVAAPDAWFQLPEVTMGLIPGAGGTVSVARRVGRHRAAWMALSGARIPVDDALAWGLVDEITPDR